MMVSPQAARSAAVHVSQVDRAAFRARWPNFSPEEIACKGTGMLYIDAPALDALQRLRTRLGKPVIVNSAYRTPKHNASIRGAAKNSMHMRGCAFDVSMANHDPVAFEAASRSAGFRGIGRYPTRGFMHLDTRPVAVAWTKPAGASWPGGAFQSSPEVPVDAATVARAAEQGLIARLWARLTKTLAAIGVGIGAVVADARDWLVSLDLGGFDWRAAALVAAALMLLAAAYFFLTREKDDEDGIRDDTGDAGFGEDAGPFTTVPNGVPVGLADGGVAAGWREPDVQPASPRRWAV